VLPLLRLWADGNVNVVGFPVVNVALIRSRSKCIGESGEEKLMLNVSRVVIGLSKLYVPSLFILCNKFWNVLSVSDGRPAIPSIAMFSSNWPRFGLS
jgi:hypothetical protein